MDRLFFFLGAHPITFWGAHGTLFFVVHIFVRLIISTSYNLEECQFVVKFLLINKLAHDSF